LEKVMSAAGRRLELRAGAAPSSIDETLIVGNLRLTPAQRLDRFTASYRNVRDFARSARRLD
jgi:hypothetical protein